MNTYTNKISENKSNTVASSLPKQQSGDTSTLSFVDNRPKSIAQRKMQEVMNNSTQSKQVVQLKNYNTFIGKPIQLVNRLTMHQAKAGGGQGSNISTSAEVTAVINSGVLKDIKDSRYALNQSIIVRQAEINSDANHLARIVQEQGWLAQLDAAITSIEAAKQAAWKATLNGPKQPPPPPGPGWKAPAGNVWGK
jgi:hypothetical protein